ncbi:sacsin N-terminal ATP-binding-like domain-containing protein [Nocardia sp. SC052]|uniref:sacsin N-terminal ATP-binding-like domain-containing protein n=1 Tax=Nocardia sichangensis TaxID=3385975 RepID=UPI0039A10A77
MALNQTAANSWSPDPGLVQDVRDQFDRAIAAYQANPHLVIEHANHEESIRVGGYANRTLLELVQNAADAMAGVVADGSDVAGKRVEIILDLQNSALYCANAGRPFSKAGLTAISHAHLSAKRGDEIGRFGLGFKSVLAVTRAPQVFSRSVSFEFNSEVANAAIATVRSGAIRYPILRTATLLDAQRQFAADPVLAELAQWATTIVKLPHAVNLDKLRKEIEGFSSEFLLFVSSVREVQLRTIGAEGFETTHTSRDMGDGVLKIERPDGTGEEWIVQDRMHRPSKAARQEVGEAVSRERVKVTVAVPARNSRQRVGRFWSYFPLQDATSASGLFNAPWSVNDDRTTLLRNAYNREILQTMSEMFAELVTRVRTPEDPASHFDYLPARGREEKSFGDSVLCSIIPQLSVTIPMIPDAEGVRRYPNELRALDLAVKQEPEFAQWHHRWSDSPNTGTDVPHWRCYTTQQRFTRLRTLLVQGVGSDIIDDESRDLKKALALVPRRGMLSWLREWAEGNDLNSAVDALRFAIRFNHADAKVVPTTVGFRAISDSAMVFLEAEEDLEIEGAAFVSPEFLRLNGVRDLLLKAGFRNLDPLAILRARVGQLSTSATNEELMRLWDAVDCVSASDAVKVLASDGRRVIKVPTRDGGWAWPRQTFDIDADLGPQYASFMLDRKRCMPNVAHSLGVVTGPQRKYSIDDEPLKHEYEQWVLQSINEILGLGDRPVERISLYPRNGGSPGPFSMLFMLREAGVPDATRVRWTYSLLSHGDAVWDCEDQDSGHSYEVTSPALWAAQQAGVAKTSLGIRRLDEVVASSLVRYQFVLPLFDGPRPVADLLALADTLEAVAPDILEAALAYEQLRPDISDAVLAEFITSATRIVYADDRPPAIPARVGRGIEPRPPTSVFIATTDEQRNFLADRHRPYLYATAEMAEELVEEVGCLRFEDTFDFSMHFEGQQSTEQILDVFAGLRGRPAAGKLVTATVTRAMRIVKRVTTTDGVEDQSQDWHLTDSDLYVQSDIDERELLRVVNEAFQLGFNNAELDGVRRAGVDHRLERLRQQARAACSDVERIEIYFGEDDLRDELPKGLWKALEAQRLVDSSTSVAQLCFTVYGTDTIRRLAEAFRREGFPDVPKAWVGSSATISWLHKMGFGPEYAGRSSRREEAEFVVPGATRLTSLHDFQRDIRVKLRDVLTKKDDKGYCLKAMVELPTGSGKTRVATQTILELFRDDEMHGTILWIAQSQELCEQAVQTWSLVWRGLGDERPLTIARLWDSNEVHEPDTEFSVVVATDAQLDNVLGRSDYHWLRNPAAVVVDEGHRAGDSERYTRILEWLGVAGRGHERPLIGLSATPFKGNSDGASERLAARFGNTILRAFERDAYRRLAEKRILARVEHEVLATGHAVKMDADELRHAAVFRSIKPSVLDKIGSDTKRMETLVEHIMRTYREGSVLVFMPSILSSQVLAAILSYRGLVAESVSGDTGRQRRREIIQRFKDRKIDVLTNCDLLVQGFDAPGVRTLYIARPTFSPNAYIQMAGRGLRGPENQGSEVCRIVDLEDNFGDTNDFLGFRKYADLWEEYRI